MTNRPDEPSLDFDTIFHLVSDRYRRYALYYVLDHTRPLPLEEMIEQIVIWNQNVAPDPLQARHEIHQNLVDIHLPELQNYDIIEYDAETQIVEVTGEFPLLTLILQHAKQDELGGT